MSNMNHPQPFHHYSEADRIKGLALIAAYDGDVVLGGGWIKAGERSGKHPSIQTKSSACASAF